mmetsp:Transcript_15767/g.29286  ORF Transcript_15767/g.29286 Transcript_15767/m.29286 type:complete len:111 (-) Transcript_15767:565-897(-)
MSGFQCIPRGLPVCRRHISDLQAATSAGVSLKVLVSTGYGQSIVGRPASLETTSEVELISTKDCSMESSTQPTILASILPFYYIQNLSSAVSFIIGLSSKEGKRTSNTKL